MPGPGRASKSGPWRERQIIREVSLVPASVRKGVCERALRVWERGKGMPGHARTCCLKRHAARSRAAVFLSCGVGDQCTRTTSNAEYAEKRNSDSPGTCVAVTRLTWLQRRTGSSSIRQSTHALARSLSSACPMQERSGYISRRPRDYMSATRACPVAQASRTRLIDACATDVLVRRGEKPARSELLRWFQEVAHSGSVSEPTTCRPRARRAQRYMRGYEWTCVPRKQTLSSVESCEGPAFGPSGHG